MNNNNGEEEDGGFNDPDTVANDNSCPNNNADHTKPDSSHIAGPAVVTRTPSTPPPPSLNTAEASPTSHYHCHRTAIYSPQATDNGSVNEKKRGGLFLLETRDQKAPKKGYVLL